MVPKPAPPTNGLVGALPTVQAPITARAVDQLQISCVAEAACGNGSGPKLHATTVRLNPRPVRDAATESPVVAPAGSAGDRNAKPERATTTPPAARSLLTLPPLWRR